MIYPSSLNLERRRIAVSWAVPIMLARLEPPKKLHSSEDKSGKIVELAVQKAIHNLPIDNKTALENPEVLQEYYQLCSGPNSLL